MHRAVDTCERSAAVPQRPVSSSAAHEQRGMPNLLRSFNSSELQLCWAGMQVEPVWIPCLQSTTWARTCPCSRPTVRPAVAATDAQGCVEQFGSSWKTSCLHRTAPCRTCAGTRPAPYQQQCRRCQSAAAAASAAADSPSMRRPRAAPPPAGKFVIVGVPSEPFELHSFAIVMSEYFLSGQSSPSLGLIRVVWI